MLFSRSKYEVRLKDIAMKGKIQTVLGPIDPEVLGFTLTHEHLLHDLPLSVFKQPFPESVPGIKDAAFSMENLGWIRQYPYCFEDNLQYQDDAVRDAVKQEMLFLKQCCGNATVVDNASVGLRTEDHAVFLRSLASEIGINLVIGTGFYVAGSQNIATLNMTQEDMENKIRDDILNGIGCTEVKCGVIGEVGCSWPIFPFEKKSLAASAVVQQETGCPVILHPGRDKEAPAEIIRVFQEAGGKVEKTVMSHLDRCFFSGDDLVEFASLGTYCEFDLFGVEVSHYQLNEDIDMPSDAQRIARMKYMVHEGFGDRLVASHDLHTKHRLTKFGGHGFSHLFTNIVPKMVRRGFTEEDIQKIFHLNPRKWLMFD